jgi:spore cortex formation protein SpoVR/YcgB (stage V sporulation)
MAAIGNTTEARFVQASKINRRLNSEISRIISSPVSDATWDRVGDCDTAYSDALNSFVQHGTEESLLRFKAAYDELLESWKRNIMELRRET